jgi:hypothetical protein
MNSFRRDLWKALRAVLADVPRTLGIAFTPIAGLAGGLAIVLVALGFLSK